MDINELTDKVELVSEKYTKEFSIKRDSDWFMLKLQEELGELTQTYLMYVNKARQKGLSNNEIKEIFENEVADVLCHVLLLSKHHNVKLEKKIQEKWLSRLEKHSDK